jgi:hypothetical protein
VKNHERRVLALATLVPELRTDGESHEYVRAAYGMALKRAHPLDASEVTDPGEARAILQRARWRWP